MQGREHYLGSGGAIWWAAVKFQTARRQCLGDDNAPRVYATGPARHRRAVKGRNIRAKVKARGSISRLPSLAVSRR